MNVYAEVDYADAGYPVVDKMESKVLGSEYPQQDIYVRLDRLETKVFGNTSKAPLSDRVERLNNAVIGKSDSTNKDEDDDEIFQNDSYSSSNIDKYSSILSILLMVLQMFL